MESKLSKETVQGDFDKIIENCENDRILDCLTKLKWRGKKLERSIFTKINKDTLSDSLIYIAEVLFGATDSERNDQQTEDEDFSILHTQNLTSETTQVQQEE